MGYPMKITKELKHASFSYDEESKTFCITQGDGLYTTVELNKVYAFAFMRFVIRMAQRNWLKGKKVLDKTPKDVVSSEDIDEIDPNQMLIFEETNNEEPEMQSSRP